MGWACLRCKYRFRLEFLQSLKDSLKFDVKLFGESTICLDCRCLGLEMGKCFIHNYEHPIELVVRNINNIPSCSDQLDKDLLHYHVHSILFVNLLFESLNLLPMTNMSLLDEFVGSINHVVMNLEHDGGCRNMMVKTIIVFFFNLFDCVHEAKGNELVEIIGSVNFRGSSSLDLGKRFTDKL